MLLWEPGVPKDPRDAVYWQTAGRWTMTKVILNGEPRYELWLGKQRFPELGSYGSAAEAYLMANFLEEMIDGEDPNQGS